MSTFFKRKKEGKDQESVQSSTTPDPEYQWESDNVTIRHHKRVPRQQVTAVLVVLQDNIWSRGQKSIVGNRDRIASGGQERQKTKR